MLTCTILCENTAGRPGIIGEFGFSALIELGRETILFDTGSGKGIIPNCLALKKNLGDVKKILISHGHYDHTEGLPQVLALTGDVEVHGHPDIFSNHLSISKRGEEEIERFIGLPYNREYLEGLGACFVLDKGFKEIIPNVFLTGEIPRITDFEPGAPGFAVRKNGERERDPLLDDQALVIRTDKGLIIIFGCGHSGIINTIQYAQKQTGVERIRALLGGTHLGPAKEEQLEKTLIRLNELFPDTVAVSHCTGMVPALRLMLEFGDSFSFANAGSVFTFN